MTDQTSQVNWYEDEVMLALENATDELLQAAAFQLEAHTKVNIRSNGQIDTGFMLNSVYALYPDGSDTYDATHASGNYQNRNGDSVARGLAPRRSLEDGAGAGVAVGAEYAAYQEQQNSFLYRALEQVRDDIGGIIQQVARDNDLTE